MKCQGVVARGGSSYGVERVPESICVALARSDCERCSVAALAAAHLAVSHTVGS